MFLNLHSKSSKKLSLQSNLGRQTYLSHHSLSNLNKQKSYSTASLKEEFRKFKNKSLSHALNNHSSMTPIKPSYCLPHEILPKDRKAPYNGSSFMKNGVQNGSNIKINDFKKSYLNLDSKLSKCAKPKDYFKPIQEFPSSYVLQPSYIEAERRLQEENVKKQLNLLEEISWLRNQNEVLKRQNQELRKQRSTDLELITRQNEIMQKQQELIEASQEAINAKQINFSNTFNKQHDRGSYTFTNNQVTIPLKSHECENCYMRKKKTLVEAQFMDLKLEKLQDQNKLLKNEIHELVYQCEKYKDAVKRAEEKYQKELDQNQKLLNIISQIQKSKYSEETAHFKNSIHRDMNLNFNNQKNLFSQNTPISLKKQKGKIYHPEITENLENFKSHFNSPKKTLPQKSSSTKSAVNLLKFNDQQFQEYESWDQRNNQQDYQKKSLLLDRKVGKVKEKSKEQNLQWCQNQNIRKYLEQINKQKINEISKIDYLLSHE